jgi:hypothetical protein
MEIAMKPSEIAYSLQWWTLLGSSPVIEAGMKEFGCCECNATMMPCLLKAR